MAENKKPAIRFKGFTDAWEQRRFEDIAERLSSTALSSKDLPYVEYEDIISEQGILSKDITCKDGQKTGIVFSEQNVLYGKLRPYLHNWLNPDFKGIAVGDWWVLNPINSDKNFVYRLIQSDNFDTVANQSTGTKMPRADWKLVSQTEFSVPVSLTEQAKIGAFFTNLDNLITLHQRKYDKLVKVKKSMLEKMFPKNGSEFPEVRFKGFTDAWEQRELGEIMDITSVKRIHQSDWTDSGIRFLRARDIVSAFKGEELSDYLYISEEKYNEYTALSGKVKVGDLLVTGVGTIGVPMLINSDNPIYFKDGNIIWFKNENKIDGQFFYYSFTNTGIQSYISESSGKGTVGTYTIESGKKTPILLPQNMEEQKAIGTYFRNLDTLITLHQRKLEKLKNIKKSMLQKMFL